MYKKVMVIDDSEMDLYIAETLIKKYSFASTTIIMDSAEEALEYLVLNENRKEGLPDMILLDINMPGMNGFEFLDAYSNLSDAIKKDCNIFMLSTSLHPADKQKALRNCCVKDFINKPLNEARLDKIKKIMSLG